ncbi:hypothetical protein HD599_000022 [Conyzicola lurida]|uniref:Uncharacterized protein n=1 Tax=Conyzicola lurida TaxID=1172621 RepID=A0A841AJT1_9MICO|nr:hypothetical protein [Conyzicola lurida]
MTRETGPSRYKWRYGPLRLAMPWLAVAVGIGMAVKGGLALAPSGSGDPAFLYMGLGLVVLGIVAFFVYRWMARRGL